MVVIHQEISGKAQNFMQSFYPIRLGAAALGLSFLDKHNMVPPFGCYVVPEGRLTIFFGPDFDILLFYNMFFRSTHPRNAA